MDVAPPTKALPPTKRRFTYLQLAVVGSLAAALLAVGVIFLWPRKEAVSPVPAQIRKDVSFQIYYPKQQKLPSGYSLDTASFRLAQPGVVIYSVVSRDAQRLTFSEEQSPGRSIIDKFTSSYIPVHTEEKTNLGQAEFGANGTGSSPQTIISLPINGGPWVIITAPATSSHADLVHIIQTLTK